MRSFIVLQVMQRHVPAVQSVQKTLEVPQDSSTKGLLTSP